MPKAAPRPCTHPGCGALVRDGTSRCPAHAHTLQRELDQRRGTSHERGYTGAWQRARLGFLKAHPLCVRCDAQGLTSAATVVDHVIPHRGDKQLFWERANWQPLCKQCHDRKTAREDGAFGRRPRAGEGG